MTDGAGSHNYTYDSLDRLSAATHPNQTNESYTFDDVGNRTASHQGSSYTYQAFNRLVTANSNSYGYDLNGTLTSKTDESGSWTYAWDYENRLRQASLSGGVTVSYNYDALGRRVQRVSTTGGTTKFVNDGADVMRDLDASGATIAEYLNGPGFDNKLRQTTSGTTSYFVTDHLGTTRGLTDAGGNLAASIGYDSFGNTGGSSSTRYTYTGREFDPDTSLYYYRARWYDPQVGRFISQDPIGFRGGINLFAYAHNAPIKNTDPMGLDDADKPWYVPDKGPLYPVGNPRPFNDGGVFSAATLVEFISANERAKQPCKKFGERFWESFSETNRALPGFAAPTGTGLITGAKLAEIAGEPTLFQWASNGFQPGRALWPAVTRVGLNYLAVGGAYESGVAIGSFIDAAGCPCGY